MLLSKGDELEPGTESPHIEILINVRSLRLGIVKEHHPFPEQNKSKECKEQAGRFREAWYHTVGMIMIIKYAFKLSRLE